MIRNDIGVHISPRRRALCVLAAVLVFGVGGVSACTHEIGVMTNAAIKAAPNITESSAE